MSTLAQVMPDALNAVIEILEAAPAMATVAEISSDKVGYIEGDEWIEISDVPGTMILEGRIFSPRFDVNCYAASLEDASTLARNAHSVLVGSKNFVGTDIVVVDVQTVTPPFKLADLMNNQPRYVFTVSVVCRPI